MLKKENVSVLLEIPIWARDASHSYQGTRDMKDNTIMHPPEQLIQQMNTIHCPTLMLHKQKYT